MLVINTNVVVLGIHFSSGQADKIYDLVTPPSQCSEAD